MNNIIKNTPVAVSGLLLAILSLGNLYNNTVKQIFLIIGLIILFILLLKLIFYRNIIINELNQLVVLSTSGTFSMAMMLLSTNIIVFNHSLALAIWIIGVVLHITLIIYFTYKYIIHNFDIKNVYGSYWVVYIGITMASITGLSFNIQYFTWIFFVFGFIMMIPTFSIVTYRYLKYPVEQEVNKPLICIYAAIFNILIVGYVHSFATINTYFLLAMYVIATCCYIFSLYKMITYLKMPFYPSYSAFTFPFVISAISSTKISSIFNSILISYVANMEILIATIMVLYVLCQYFKNIILI